MTRVGSGIVGGLPAAWRSTSSSAPVEATIASAAASAISAGTALAVAAGAGAAQFGLFTVVISLALLISIAPLLAQHQVMYQELPRADAADRPELIATAWWSTLGSSLAVAAVGLLLTPVVVAATGLAATTLHLALGVAVTMTLSMVAESFVRGLRRYLLIARIRLAVAVTYLGTAIIGLWVLDIGDATLYLGALMATNLLLTAAALVVARPAPRAFSLGRLRVLSRHGGVLTITAALVTVGFGADVVLLDRWAPAADVGTYALYNGLPKRLLGVVLVDGIGLALLPWLATLDKPTMMRRIERSAPLVAAAAGLLSFAASAALIPLIGGDYPFSLPLLGLASVGIAVHTVMNVYFFGFTMSGPAGARTVTVCLGIGVPLALAAQVVLISSLGLEGALVAFIVGNVLVLAPMVIAGRLRYRTPRTESR